MKKSCTLNSFVDSHTTSSLIRFCIELCWLDECFFNQIDRLTSTRHKGILHYRAELSFCYRYVANAQVRVFHLSQMKPILEWLSGLSHDILFLRLFLVLVGDLSNRSSICLDFKIWSIGFIQVARKAKWWLRSTKRRRICTILEYFGLLEIPIQSKIVGRYKILSWMEFLTWSNIDSILLTLYTSPAYCPAPTLDFERWFIQFFYYSTFDITNLFQECSTWRRCACFNIWSNAVAIPRHDCLIN